MSASVRKALRRTRGGVNLDMPYSSFKRKVRVVQR
jgi:hypothetical protein